MFVRINLSCVCRLGTMKQNKKQKKPWWHKCNDFDILLLVVHVLPYIFFSQWKPFCKNSVCVYWCINYRLLEIVTCFVWGFFSLVDHSLKRHDAELTGRHFYFNIQLTSRNFCNKLIATISEFVFCKSSVWYGINSVESLPVV